jgi:predicted kinase
MVSKMEKPKFYLLIGLPYSGKSSFANNACEEDTFTVIEQHGSKKEFEDKLMKSLGNKENIILDRLNLDNKYRIPLIQKAKEFGYDVTAFWFDVSHDILEERYMMVEGSDNQNERARMLEFFHLTNFEKPLLDEGYDEIVKLSWNNFINDYEYSLINAESLLKGTEWETSKSRSN